jgi:hypothetical protein
MLVVNWVLVHEASAHHVHLLLHRIHVHSNVDIQVRLIREPWLIEVGNLNILNHWIALIVRGLLLVHVSWWPIQWLSLVLILVRMERFGTNCRTLIATLLLVGRTFLESTLLPALLLILSVSLVRLFMSEVVLRVAFFHAVFKLFPQ